jgi:hypothetical protein
MKLKPQDLEKITDLTLRHYNEYAEYFWEGKRDHNVSQNIAALLQSIEGEPPYTILDFGCGPGRPRSDGTVGAPKLYCGQLMVVTCSLATAAARSNASSETSNVKMISSLSALTLLVIAPLHVIGRSTTSKDSGGNGRKL